ncbi:MAG: hypothetical protein J3R72DRAFT_446647, partial [Linnemannia gamsii]
MDGEDSPLQSLQRGPQGRILHVEAYYHPQSRQYVVLWDDILEVFPDATNVLHGTVAATRARDENLRFIEPRCIKYQPGRVLVVIVREELTPALGTSASNPLPAGKNSSSSNQTIQPPPPCRTLSESIDYYTHVDDRPYFLRQAPLPRHTPSKQLARRNLTDLNPPVFQKFRDTFEPDDDEDFIRWVSTTQVDVNMRIVMWSDIVEVFPQAYMILLDNFQVPFLRDENLKLIVPRRIAANTEVTYVVAM